jgi:hypothetical protein
MIYKSGIALQNACRKESQGISTMHLATTRTRIAFAFFQAEMIFSALLVANVAAVFLVWRVVRVIQAHRGITLEDVRVRIPHDRIHGVRGVVRDPPGLQGDWIAVRGEFVGQKLPVFEPGLAGLGSKGWMLSSGCPPPGPVGIR